MRATRIPQVLLLSLSLSIACADQPAAAPSPPVLPAPLPPLAAEPAAALAPVQPEPVASAAQQPALPPHAATKRAASKAELATASGAKAKSAEPIGVPAPAPVPVLVKPPAPTPMKPVASAATKVLVPRTQHVHVDVPAGLQRWLDEDDRMVPWLAQVIGVIDKCYAYERAKNADAAGTISVGVVMHQNARPDADIKSLPPALSGVLACATSGLMRARMPLFTGTEGASYKLSVYFERGE